MAKHNAYRDNRVHVCREMCSTCVFRPGNQMDLEPGRVAGMVKEATRNESAIICHSTSQFAGLCTQSTTRQTIYPIKSVQLTGETVRAGQLDVATES